MWSGFDPPVEPEPSCALKANLDLLQMAQGELGAGLAGSLLSTGLSKCQAAVPDVWHSRRKLHSWNDCWFLLYFTSTAGAGQPQKQRLPLGIPGAKGCLEKMNASSLQT